MKKLKVIIIADEREGHTEALLKEQAKAIIASVANLPDVFVHCTKYLGSFSYRELSFPDGKQWRCDFVIHKKNPQIKWDDIVFNTIEPLKKCYVNYCFYKI